MCHVFGKSEQPQEENVQSLPAWHDFQNPHPQHNCLTCMIFGQDSSRAVRCNLILDVSFADLPCLDRSPLPIRHVNRYLDRHPPKMKPSLHMPTLKDAIHPPNATNMFSRDYLNHLSFEVPIGSEQKPPTPLPNARPTPGRTPPGALAHSDGI